MKDLEQVGHSMPEDQIRHLERTHSEFMERMDEKIANGDVSDDDVAAVLPATISLLATADISINEMVESELDRRLREAEAQLRSPAATVGPEH